MTAEEIKEQRKKDLKFLQRGDIGKILTASGVTRRAFNFWLNGDRENSSVEVYFNRAVELRKKEVEEFNV